MGTKDRSRLAVALCLLIPLGGTAGCAYEDPEPPPAAAGATGAAGTAGTLTAGAEPVAGAQKAYNDPQVLETEAANYAELDRLLGSGEPVLLSDAGPLDGPLRGFGSFERVAAAGQYTVTAACVGASGAKVFVGQEHPGAPFQPADLVLDCARATSQVIALQPGYVFAHLYLAGPGDTPWTGAVGGVRLSANG